MASPNEWGALVAMATRGAGVNLHHADVDASAGMVRWLRASCGVEEVGLVLEWNVRLRGPLVPATAAS